MVFSDDGNRTATPRIDRRCGHRAARAVAPQPSLAARHARALYRPVPPVGYDDEGHPESDSAAVESLTHEKLQTYAVSVLRSRYEAHPGFFAGSNLGLLFERGNPAAVMAPDLLVSFVAGDHAPSSYKLWQEPVPDLVKELLSPRTWRRDVEAKPGLYEALGVREFWLFDPIGRLPRPINGWRLDAGGPTRRFRRCRTAATEARCWASTLSNAATASGTATRRVSDCCPTSRNPRKR